MLYLIDVYGDGDNLVLVEFPNEHKLRTLLNIWRALDERMLNNALAVDEEWVGISEFLFLHGIRPLGFEYIPL